MGLAFAPTAIKMVLMVMNLSLFAKDKGRNGNDSKDYQQEAFKRDSVGEFNVCKILFHSIRFDLIRLNVIRFSFQTDAICRLELGHN